MGRYSISSRYGELVALGVGLPVVGVRVVAQEVVDRPLLQLEGSGADQLRVAGLGSSSCAWAMIPMRPEPYRNEGKAGQGVAVVTVTVRSSTTSTECDVVEHEQEQQGVRAG